MPDDTALVTAYLADRHVACPACGYDLHGAAGESCPECGDRIRLQLGSTQSLAERIQKLLLVAGAVLVLAGLGLSANEAYMLKLVAQYGAPGALQAMSWTTWESSISAALQLPFGVAICVAAMRRGSAQSPRRMILGVRLLVVWLVTTILLKLVVAAAYLLGWD